MYHVFRMDSLSALLIQTNTPITCKLWNESFRYKPVLTDRFAYRSLYVGGRALQGGHAQCPMHNTSLI
jgi:hypothetical protein